MFRNGAVEVGGHCSAASFLHRGPGSMHPSLWKPLCGAIGVGVLWKPPRNILEAAKAPLFSPSTSRYYLQAGFYFRPFSQDFRNVQPKAGRKNNLAAVSWALKSNKQALGSNTPARRLWILTSSVLKEDKLN